MCTFRDTVACGILILEDSWAREACFSPNSGSRDWKIPASVNFGASNFLFSPVAWNVEKKKTGLALR